MSEGGSESGDEAKRRRRRLSGSDVDSPDAAGDVEKKRKQQRFVVHCLALVFILLHVLDTVSAISVTLMAVPYVLMAARPYCVG